MTWPFNLPSNSWHLQQYTWQSWSQKLYMCSLFISQKRFWHC